MDGRLEVVHLLIQSSQAYSLAKAMAAAGCDCILSQRTSRSQFAGHVSLVLPSPVLVLVPAPTVKLKILRPTPSACTPAQCPVLSLTCLASETVQPHQAHAVQAHARL